MGPSKPHRQASPARRYRQASPARRYRVGRVQDHTFLPRFLNRASVVVDLGAHLGAFAEAVSRSFGCRAYAVEASPHLCRQIREGPLLRKFNCAIAAADGEVTLSICRQPDGSSICAVPPEEVVERIVVPGLTLVSFLRRAGLLGADDDDRAVADLMKMDIEGAEVAVLEATPDEVLRRIGQLSVEFHDFRGLLSGADVARVKRRLKGLGFAAVKFTERRNVDLLFINRCRCPVSAAELLYLRIAIGLLRDTWRRWDRALRQKLYPLLAPLLWWRRKGQGPPARPGRAGAAKRKVLP